MKRGLLILTITIASCVASDAATAVYQNTFDTMSSIDQFTIYSQSFVGFNPPPLHHVSVVNGEVHIETDANRPNGPGTNPVLLGRADLMLDTSSLGSGYNSTISSSAGLVSWSFNVANQDGEFNNGFEFVLLSSNPDPHDVSAHGYVFKGGSLAGDRMTLTRFDFGVGGGQSTLIDITNGLGTLPQTGSFKITYNPFNDEWDLFGSISPQFVDPDTVQNLFGTATDGTYTHLNTPYFGFGGLATGLDIFDNVTIAVVPEPSTLGMILFALFVAAIFFRTRARL
jgi:hypothetical protein